MKNNNQKLRFFKIAFYFSLLVIVVGCGHSYKYRGENYRSPEEGLAAQRAYLDEIKSQIAPTEKKNRGSAAIVIPTFDTFVALAVTKKGNPAQELIDYVGKILVASYRGMYDALDKRKIFDKVTLIEDNYPIPVAKKIIAEYDAVIYLNLAGPTQVQWFIRVAPQYNNVPLDMDKSKPEGAPRIISLLDNIERHLDEVNYKPMR